ncbi:MAG: hypothetical protein ACI3XX_00405 [Eubacteriales bacterium]
MDKPQYIEYKGLPLVREGDVICYGDLSEKYMLLLNILTKKADGEPDAILVQICHTDDRQKIEKQSFKNGLYDALDLGVEWLEHMLKDDND